jgi:hypothetical protein
MSAADPSKPAGTFCRRTRREFLWEAGGGFTGLAMTGLLSWDGFFNRAEGTPADHRAFNPLAPRPSHYPAKAKSVIATAKGIWVNKLKYTGVPKTLS